MTRHHSAFVRITLTLDPDVTAKARKGASKLGKPFRDVINAAPRIGLDKVLEPPVSKPYRTKGLRDGKATGNLASDAHLAALAVEHNCLLQTTDADFARFRGLKWSNPILEKEKA
jgi:predicted nucleic acid-binding protein